MKKDNKKALYESIMTSVAKEVKKALNEYDGWTTTTTLDDDVDINDGDFVDLGLDVKWAKYNLGAKPGKNAEDWYGDYYAWGETEPKLKYIWTNYKYLNSDEENLLKYNKKDRKNSLMPNDDAATVNWGRPWRMPRREDYEVLLEHTTNRWVTDYKGIQGLNGRVFTSKVNGNKLFIPAAGYCFGSRIGGSDCSYSGLWTSNLSYDRADQACFMGMDRFSIEMGCCSRCIGYPIRPVC